MKHGRTPNARNERTNNRSIQTLESYILHTIHLFIYSRYDVLCVLLLTAVQPATTVPVMTRSLAKQTSYTCDTEQQRVHPTVNSSTAVVLLAVFPTSNSCCRHASACIHCWWWLCLLLQCVWWFVFAASG